MRANKMDCKICSYFSDEVCEAGLDLNEDGTCPKFVNWAINRAMLGDKK